MKGKKTGGRVKGTPNKRPALKQQLLSHSMSYYEPSVTVSADLAAELKLEPGTVVSRFELDLAAMKPSDRAAIEERILRYHTPQMQAVEANIDLGADADVKISIAQRLAQLAADSN